MPKGVYPRKKFVLRKKRHIQERDDRIESLQIKVRRAREDLELIVKRLSLTLAELDD